MLRLGVYRQHVTECGFNVADVDGQRTFTSQTYPGLQDASYIVFFGLGRQPLRPTPGNWGVLSSFHYRGYAENFMDDITTIIRVGPREQS